MRLVLVYFDDKNFRAKWNSVFRAVAKADVGKSGLATAGAIIGLVLGGVGLAGALGAVGIPLATILRSGGFILGNEIDADTYAPNGRIY
jgi:hypothetical protein